MPDLMFCPHLLWVPFAQTRHQGGEWQGSQSLLMWSLQVSFLVQRRWRKGGERIWNGKWKTHYTRTLGPNKTHQKYGLWLRRFPTKRARLHVQTCIAKAPGRQGSTLHPREIGCVLSPQGPHRLHFQSMFLDVPLKTKFHVP